jgi:hypothetical protein
MDLSLPSWISFVSVGCEVHKATHTATEIGAKLAPLITG